MKQSDLLKDLKKLINAALTVVMSFPTMSVMKPFEAIIFILVDILFDWLSAEKPGSTANLGFFA
jgi:hypothetical protein